MERRLLLKVLLEKEDHMLEVREFEWDRRLMKKVERNESNYC